MKCLVRLQGHRKPAGKKRVFDDFASISAQLVHESWNRQTVLIPEALLGTGDDSEVYPSLSKAHVDKMRTCVLAGPQGHCWCGKRARGRWKALGNRGEHAGWLKRAACWEPCLLALEPLSRSSRGLSAGSSVGAHAPRLP